MSGIVSGINYNILFSGETGADAGAAILNALYSGSSSSTPTTTFVSSGNPITDLKLAQQEQTTGVAAEAKQPQVANVINAFTKAVSSATSIQQALLNPNVQQVLLTANGLSNYIGETALVQKVLLSDPTQSNSLVNQLNDPTWLSTVQTYNFAQNGLAELQNPQVMSTLTNAYAEVEWRQGLDQATPGLANALTFLGQASSITSVNDVLSNDTNFEVVTTALGIPQDIVFQDQSAQENAISSRLNIPQLQNRNYVTSITDQYLLAMQENNQSSTSLGTGLSALAEQANGLVV
ncbi:MAG TPA: DUF1217 domain-containing protein [Acetobacteraceae bacterium]|nr:DUF1217 domain-containing protein [Acetobacteraceae bacterium]